MTSAAAFILLSDSAAAPADSAADAGVATVVDISAIVSLLVDKYREGCDKSALKGGVAWVFDVLCRCEV